MSEYVIFWRHPLHSHGAPQGGAAPTLRKADVDHARCSVNQNLSHAFISSLMLSKWNICSFINR